MKVSDVAIHEVVNSPDGQPSMIANALRREGPGLPKQSAEAVLIIANRAMVDLWRSVFDVAIKHATDAGDANIANGMREAFAIVDQQMSDDPPVATTPKFFVQ